MSPATEPPESQSVDALRAKLSFRRMRLELAESNGRPLHIARCRDQVTALEIKLESLEHR